MQIIIKIYRPICRGLMAMCSLFGNRFVLFPPLVGSKFHRLLLHNKTGRKFCSVPPIEQEGEDPGIPDPTLYSMSWGIVSA